MGSPYQPSITSQLTVLSSSSVEIQFNLYNNGGSDFTNMEYARSIDGYTAWTSLGLSLPIEGQTSATITGLSSLYGYFKIRTVTAYGNSPASDPQTAISSSPPLSSDAYLILSNSAFVAASCTSSGQYMCGITNTGVFLASSDYGKTFRQAWENYYSQQREFNNIMPMSTFAVTSNGQTIYVSNSYNGSVYRSNDYGVSFTELSINGNVPLFKAFVSSSDGTYIYGLRDNAGSAIIGSIDGGATWVTFGSMNVNWNSIACSSNGAYVYAVGSDVNSLVQVMYMSSDNGVSWSVVPSFTSNSMNIVMNSVSCNSTGQYVVVTTETEGIYRSSDYGSTWSLINGNTGGAIGVNWVSIASDASGANLIAGESTYNSVYYSTNSGATWTAFNVDLSVPNMVAISSNGTYRMIGSNDFTIINQFPSQATSDWTLTSGQYLQNVKIASDNLHIAAVKYNPDINNQIAISTDGGSNWTYTFSPDDDNVERVTASLSGQKVYYRTGYITTYASTDYGSTFSELTNAPNSTNLIVCDSTGARVYIATYDGSIYVSTDSGSNFTPTYQPNVGSINGIACSASGQYVYGSCQNAIYISSDYGLSFTSSLIGGYVNYDGLVCDQSGQKLLAATTIGIYSSIDYGATWTNTSFLNNTTHITCDAVGNRVIIKDDNSVYQSLDAGSSWTPITLLGSSFSYGSGNSGLGISPDGTISFISTKNPGTYRRSAGIADVEPVWTAINGVYYWQGAISTNNQNMVSLHYNYDDDTQRVAYSSDAGVTWNDAADIGWTAALGASASCQYVLVGNDDNASPLLHYSSNYGQTFTELMNSAPAYYPYRVIAVNPNGSHLIAIGSIQNAGPYFSCLSSTDSGVSWNEIYQFPGFDYIDTLASSQTLDRLYVIGWDYGVIRTSTDYGNSWSDLPSFSPYEVRSISCDWSGRYVVAAVGLDGIYRSTDYGATWTKTNAPSDTVNEDNTYMNELRSNSTGSRLIALDDNNNIVYVSLDSGTTWTTLSTPGGSTSGDGYWGIALSPDGTRSMLSFDTPGTFFETYGTPDLPAVPCFLEGTKILCRVNGEEQYVAVETIRPGMLVKTLRDGYKAVKLIGHRAMENPGTAARDKNSLYVCSKAAYPEITEDLTITGCHAILVDQVTDVHRRGIIKTLERIFVTDKKYRLPACVDERASVVQTAGTFTVWHFALEHHDTKMNYGVYAQGLLVESSPIWHMNLKNYTLV